MAAPDWTGNRTGGPRRTGGQDRARAGPGPADRTAPDRHGRRTGTETGPRRTGSGASRRTGPAARRRRPAPTACNAGPKPETATTSTKARTGPAQGLTGGLLPNGLKRRLKTGAPNSARQEAASRAGGVLCARCSLLIAGYIRPLPPTSQPGRMPGPDRRTGTGPDRPRRTTKPRPHKIQHIRAQARIKTAREAVGTPWAPLAACGSVSAGFF